MKKCLLTLFVLIVVGVQYVTAQNCTIGISGNNCTGSQLTAVTDGSALSSLSWRLYDFSVFYADTVSSPASVSVVAGNHGMGSGAAQFSFPTGGIALDKEGNVYIADYGNDRVQKWVKGAETGITVAGGHGAGSAANQLNGPRDVFVDGAGNVYVADQANHRIQKWAPGATSGVTVAGGNGYGAAANQLSGPAGVYVDAASNIYIADVYNYRVQKWASGAKKGTTVAGGNGYGFDANQFSYPTDVYLDAGGNIYVADVYTEDGDYHRVQKWAPGATTGITVAGGPGVFGYLLAITVDADGTLYTADNGISGTPISLVKKWTPGATHGVTVAGGHNNGWDQLSYPTGVALDSSKNLYVLAGVYAPKVQKYTPTDGVVNTKFTPTQPGSYKLYATYKNGCTAISEQVYVQAPPGKPIVKATNKAATGNLCYGGLDTFVVSNREDNISYLWTVPAKCKIIADLGDSVVVKIPVGFKSGWVTVAASNACGSSIRDSLKLQGNPAKPSKIKGPAMVDAGTITSYSVADAGGTYCWSVPEGASIIEGQNSAGITVKWGNNPGTVGVYVVTRCGISGRQQLYVSVKNSSAFITKNNALPSSNSNNASVFPNPTKDKTTLVFHAAAKGSYHIAVQDLTGKILQYKEVLFIYGKNQISVELGSYAAGVYQVIIYKGNKQLKSMSVIKE